MGSSEEDEYYSIVHLFPTGKYRFDISNFTENRDYLVLCNTIGPRNLDDLRAFIFVCTKVATYINDFYTKWPIENEIDHCKYLNYSINDIVKNDGNHNYNEENLIKAYDTLATRLSECKYRIKPLKKSVLKNVKELSNIYYKFNKYINAIKENPNTDCKDVYDSVKYYRDNENSCKGVTNKFCVALDDLKKYLLSNISLVNCDKEEHNLKYFLSLDNTKNVKLEEEAEAQGRKDITNVVENEREEAMGTKITEPLSNTKLVDGDNNGEPGNHNASSPVRTITYTSLGLVLPIVTLYRFTPLGSWVNTKILGKNKLMDNMKRNHYELLLNDVRNGEMGLNDTTYSISYNSAAK
ncbi:Plasmodium vivax Vir protein, putative [Plasmodium vivax]|uniref:Vir protein, putative n=1 Tax=Plasmodium vivax TaxID=5855 RepID=A0A1G4EA34_PLAVI|nr:Plasmodium vivax Vir protein, putative [Plasmodium vivax]